MVVIDARTAGDVAGATYMDRPEWIAVHPLTAEVYVTLSNNQWQQIVWEIDPLPRDRITMIEIGYWVNKMLAAPTDRVAFEIGRVELQRVEAAGQRLDRGVHADEQRRRGHADDRARAAVDHDGPGAGDGRT